MSPEAARAYLAGYMMAKSQAAYIARLYQDELLSMAIDTWALDPTNAGDGSAQALAKSAAVGREGLWKGMASVTAGNIAGAIEGMRL